MGDGRIERSPIWADIRTLGASELPRRHIDIIYGGFPCQDISVAGHGKGLAGERSGLFFEIVRLAKEIKPKFIFLENVPAILTRGGSTVVQTVAEMGYDCRWCVISAASIGALHRRERWFLLANARSHRGRADPTRHQLSAESEKLQQQDGETCSNNVTTSSANVSNADPSECSRLSMREEEKHASTRVCGQYGTINEWQEAVSKVCRITDGVPQRVDRLRGLGNAVVPDQAKEAFKILMGLKV
jgi:DNA (cytosine-5)-methyltransferase 1